MAAENHRPHTDIRLIGVGNEFRQDDGVGIFIVRHPGLLHLHGVQVAEEQREGTQLMDFWKRAGTVFLFDAVFSGSTPGEICRFNAIKESLPHDFFRLSTHTFGVIEAVKLSRTLNQLPNELIVFGIEGKNFGPGQGLSSPSEQAALEVIRRVLEEIRSLNRVI